MFSKRAISSNNVKPLQLMLRYNLSKNYNNIDYLEMTSSVNVVNLSA